MAELMSMKNIGKTMDKKLKAVGIGSAEQLREMGSKQAFRQMKAAYPETCLVHLYTLQAAVEGIRIEQLPERARAELKAFSDSLK